jgi:hypothetical protein
MLKTNEELMERFIVALKELTERVVLFQSNRENKEHDYIERLREHNAIKKEEQAAKAAPTRSRHKGYTVVQGPRKKGYKLFANEAVEIYHAGGSYTKIADYYGVHPVTVAEIKTGRTWWKVTGHPKHPDVVRNQQRDKIARINKKESSDQATVKKRKLGEEDVMEIYTSPASAPVLARRYGISPTTVAQIRNGRLWSRVTGHAKPKRNKKKK